MKKLTWDGSVMDAEVQKRAVEAALLLGFQSETAVFPVIGKDGTIPVPETERDLEKLWTLEEKQAPKGYEPASDHAGPVFDLDFREEKGLETIFGTGAFLKDDDHDLLPDRMDVKLVLPPVMDAGMLTAACNIAFRLGMETTGYEGRIVAEEGYTGNAIIFEAFDRVEMVAEDRTDVLRVHIKGSGDGVAEFTSVLCETFPQIGGQRTWRDFLLELTDDFALRGADGQLAWLKSCTGEYPGAYELYGSPLLKGRKAEEFFGASVYNYKSGRIVYEKTYELPWEVECFSKVLEEEVYPKLQSGDAVEITGALSEDRESRCELVKEMTQAVEEKGASLIKAEVICAYKQGFSWIDEVVLPDIRELHADRVEISFKPFLPKGQTEWLDEDGATPSQQNMKADHPDKWYDLPIRYLQELYPAEDRLTKELGIGPDQVVFLPYEGEEEITYLCRAYRGQELCYENTCLAHCFERPYMNEYPQLGKVHPATGFIKVSVNGREILSRRIRTDLEAVWDVYQEEVLPDCKAYIEEKTDGDIRADMQPFFHELRLDVSVSEPDYRAGSREDLISSLDALHEDMYFAGSDYFKNYGIQKADVALDAPGLILPLIHNRKGRPVFRVTLLEPLKEMPCILRDGVVVCEQRDRSEINLKIKRIVYEEQKLSVSIAAKGVPQEVLRCYTELFGEGLTGSSLWGHSAAGKTGRIGRLRFVAEGEENVFRCQAKLPEVSGQRTSSAEAEMDAQMGRPKKITDIDLHEHELIGYDTYMEIIGQLKQVPELEVFRTAVSYTGRELYAIWLKPKYKGYLSMTKRLSRVPSEIINARHHANEVSSTNATFILLKKLLTDDIYKELPEKLNLVLVPMENVDGAAIHYELQKEHPYWKFHVARFNSLGKEFYYEHFQQDTIHSEAMGLTRLFEMCVPDVIVDNHGVPSHEWEQQFSGYTSPSYKGFWLPRSLLYGYFWYVTNPEYKDNYPVNQAMEDVIADAIAEDEEMAEWNRQWSRQFEKYAHAWLPRLFPADYYKNMINYWIAFAADENHRYPSIRFPWITTVAYTSEVADETAQGEYLHLCARAHVAHDEATLQMLLKAEHVREAQFICGEERIFARYRRQRPMIVSGLGKR